MDIREIEYKAEEMRIVNLAVMKDGQVILKRDWDVEMRRNQYSASKSFTSAAVGIAEREGLLGLEESSAMCSGRKSLKILQKICRRPRCGICLPCASDRMALISWGNSVRLWRKRTGCATVCHGLLHRSRDLFPV